MLLKQCAKIAVIKTKILVKKMKFTIERANLLKSLSHVQSIVEKRNTIPVLSNVRIEAMEDGISFKATDMDTEITEIVDAKTIETGATTAPPAARNLPFPPSEWKIFRSFPAINCRLISLWQKKN